MSAKAKKLINLIIDLKEISAEKKLEILKEIVNEAKTN